MSLMNSTVGHRHSPRITRPSDRRRVQDTVVDDRDPLDPMDPMDEDLEQGEREFISWLLGRPIDNDPFDYVWRDWDDAVAQLSCCPGEAPCDEPLCRIHGREAALNEGVQSV